MYYDHRFFFLVGGRFLTIRKRHYNIINNMKLRTRLAFIEYAHLSKGISLLFNLDFTSTSRFL